MNNQDFAYDPDGNMVLGMVGGVMTDLAYDKQSRLTKVGGHTFDYDVEGLRIQSENGGLSRRYVQDGCKGCRQHHRRGLVLRHKDRQQTQILVALQGDRL